MARWLVARFPGGEMSRQKLSLSSVGFSALNGECVVGKENRG